MVKVVRFKTLAMLLFILSGLAQAEATFQEGKDYKLLDNPIDTDNPSQVEVREFFWYGCSHCYKLEPHIEAWSARRPSDVSFVRTPAVLNPGWALHGRSYYVAKQLGVENDIHGPLFDSIHQQKRKLDSRASLMDFFVAQGIEKKAFEQAFDSFSINTQIKQADAKARAARLTGVPAIVVNGKYVTDRAMAKSYPRMMQVIDFLIEKERRQARQPGQS